jgi:flagellar biosynthesis/type III secretory pathway chaperone
MAIQRLIDILNQLDDVHQSMLVSGQTKKEAIIKDDINALIQIMNQESRMMKQITSLEEERVAACQAFLREKGIKSALNLNITELARLVFDPEKKAALQQAQSALSMTLEKLKRVNDLNQQLLAQSLTFIDYSLNLFGGGPEYEATYQHPSGNSNTGPITGLFDARA